MTSMRNLVVHVNDESLSGQAIELAALLARHWDARLTALLVAAPVNAGVGLGAETAALAQQLAQAQRDALRAMGERLVTDIRLRLPIDIDLQLTDGDSVEALQAWARTADMLITSQRGPQGEGGLSVGQSARLLVGAACPVLTVPYIGWSDARAQAGPDAYLRRVLVAWSDTRESARAVRDALPLLMRASHVELVSFTAAGRDDAALRQESLQQVANYLERHGVPVNPMVLTQTEPSIGERMRRGWVPDVAVAEALQSHAADTQADLLVMGAFGHPRLWEMMLGGVTRTMLESMTVPVLMSH